MLILCLAMLLNSFISSSSFRVESLRFSIYSIISSAYSDNFTLPFQFIFLNFYWSIINLQCFNFSYRAKWLNYSYVCIFLVFFSIMVYPGYWIWLHVLYSMTFLFIHSIYNSLYLLTPNFQSTFLQPSLPLSSHNSVLYVCESAAVS